MTISPGEFWLAKILYTDQSAAKIRPVLVLWLPRTAVRGLPFSPHDAETGARECLGRLLGA